MAAAALRAWTPLSRGRGRCAPDTDLAKPRTAS